MSDDTKLILLALFLLGALLVVSKLVTASDRIHELQSNCVHLFPPRETVDQVIFCALCGKEDQKPYKLAGSWINADDVDRLVRQIDVAINGPGGAARQASLCDVTSQIESLFGDHARIEQGALRYVALRDDQQCICVPRRLP